MNKLMLLLIVVVSLIILLPVLLIEGADCPPSDPKCGIIIPERTPDATATAPLPTCSDAGVPCFTPTPNEHWINPEPWPTYDYPDPYPAPEETPDSYPAPYPEPQEPPDSYPQPQQQNQTTNGGSLAGIWAWIWDLFTN